MPKNFEIILGSTTQKILIVKMTLMTNVGFFFWKSCIDIKEYSVIFLNVWRQLLIFQTHYWKKPKRSRPNNEPRFGLLLSRDYDMSWASIKSLSRFNCERSPLRGKAFIPRWKENRGIEYENSRMKDVEADCRWFQYFGVRASRRYPLPSSCRHQGHDFGWNSFTLDDPMALPSWIPRHRDPSKIL